MRCGASAGIKGAFVLFLSLFVNQLWAERQIAPSAYNGVLDLSRWNLKNNGPVQLNGKWSFYWNRLLIPETIASAQPDGYFEVPGHWNRYSTNQGKTFPVNGYATYRLRIKGNFSNQTLGLKILTVSTSYRLWVNQMEVASNGVVGTNRAATTPEYYPTEVFFTPQTNCLTIVMQVANFDYRKSGIWRPLTLGTADEIHHIKHRTASLDMFVVGALFIIAFYYFGLFFFYRQDLTSLYFGAICVMFAIRSLATGDILFTFLFGHTPFGLLLKMEFLPYYLGSLLFAGFIRYMFPRATNPIVIRIIQVISGLVTLFVIFTPVRINNYLVVPYQFFVAILGIYFFGVIIYATTRQFQGSVAMLITSTIFLFTILNDIFYANNQIAIGYIVPFGVFVLVLGYSLILSRRFSHAYVTIGELTAEVTKIEKEEKRAREQVRLYQRYLEKIVENRTQELATANKKLTVENKERLRAEQELRENEFRFRKLFEGSPDAIFVEDYSGYVLDVNPAACRLHGLGDNDKALLIGRHVSDLVPEETQLQVMENFPRMANGEINRSRGFSRRFDGVSIPVEIRANRIQYMGRDALLLFVRDMSESSLAEQELRESQERLSRTQELAHLGSWEYDTQSGKLRWSDETFRIAGLPPQKNAPAYAEYLDSLHPEDRSLFEIKMDDALHESKSFEAELRHLRPDGTYNYTLTRGQPIVRDGKTVKVIGSILDNTEQRLLQERLRKLSRAVEQSNTSVVITDLEGHIEYVNPRFSELTGYSPEEVMGQNPRILKSDNYPQEVYKQLWETICAGKSWKGEFLNKNKQGELYWESASIAPIRNSRGEITHFFKVAEDLTNYKRAQEELTRAFAELEQTNHELRAINDIMTQELELARKIQMGLIPRVSPVPNLAFYYRPMEKVGGDFFYILSYANGMTGVFLSDVSGHGVPAAFVTLMLHSYITQFAEILNNPAELLEHLNDFLMGKTGGNFVTALYGMFDPRNGKFVYSSAGHNPPYLLSQEKVDLIENQSKGYPLAIMSSEEMNKLHKEYTNQTVLLQPGDKLVLYTDGLTEAINIETLNNQPDAPINDFENTKLRQKLASLAPESCSRLIDEVVRSLIDFRGTEDFDDDVCIICLERN